MDLGQPVVYAIAGMDRVDVTRDVVYKRTEDAELRLDVYHPFDRQQDERRPAVIFVHGDGPQEILATAKDWGQYVSWGRLAAASGLIGVTFNHRSTQRLTRLATAAADVDDLISCVRANAGSLGIDPDALSLWTCSAGGPVALSSTLANPPVSIRCIVALYALLDLQHVRQHQELAPGITDEELRAFSPLHHLPPATTPVPPMFIARAGLDQPRFNDAIDRFVAEALTRNLSIEIVNHATGQHAFDVRDDNPRSQEIIRNVLRFIATHTLPG